jgi:hypothetical protein
MRVITKAALLCTLLTSAQAFAGTTTVDLYRSGNTTSARMDNVRTQDVTQVTENGVVYVLPNTGGISTSTSAAGLSTTVWKIPKATTYPDTLKVWNDSPGHWAWEPAAKMTLSSFTAALAGMNAKAVKN